MNITQYKPSNTMVREAIASLPHFASITEAVAAAGQADEVPSRALEPFGEPRLLEADGFTCTYDIALDGTARILKCSSCSNDVVMPREIDGHPVAVIAPHAFSTCYGLERIALPENLLEIGEYAFMNTALRSIQFPPKLAAIRQNAFYKCALLKEADLNPALAHIGASAFRETALRTLEVPANVSLIGQNAFKDTRLSFTGPDQSLLIADGNSHFLLADGALYRTCAEGTELVQVLDDAASSFTCMEGVTSIAARAFAGLKALERVSLPNGVTCIGEAAFKGCTALTHAGLPDSLRSIGRHAFADTALAALRIPASLETVGVAAFYTGGSIARNFRRTLTHVDISPENERFYMCDSILCQRGDDGDVALLYTGCADCISIPRNVTSIGPYAFLAAPNTSELRIHDGIRSIDVGGFDFGHAVTTVLFDEWDGDGPARTYAVRFPPGQAGRQAVRTTFARGHFELGFAYAAADDATLVTQDTLIRSKAMLERLADPVMLGAGMRFEFEKRLRRSVPTIIVAFGEGGFLQGIDMLFDAGFITADALEASLRATSDAGEIAAYSRLMELKRTSFNAPMFDFEL
ncbi:MAG: leucine-rich repeat protein [Eggerthellaceae bacterium]|nr:leucine-rich repeat protein [Eggerthellaceae bacterium]